MRKICVVTGTRAEYGLLSGVIKKINYDSDIQLQLLVTGTHLSPEFGHTFSAIENDGFQIDEKVEMLVSGDSSISIVKSLGLGIIGFADALNRLKPDLVLILGDRYEILGAAQVAMLMSIPIAHIHGGEVTEGAFDDAIRHSISKMSQIHFVAHEDFAHRLRQLGEDPSNIHVTGAPGIDNIHNIGLLDRHELSLSLGIELGARNFLVTVHPETLSSQKGDNSIEYLLEALDYYRDAKIIITASNADEGGRLINEKMKVYSSSDPDRVHFFDSLGIQRYLSALSCFDAVIGNSSSGLLEAPTFKIPTVNIGGRQNGRPLADSVISCDITTKEIVSAINKALSDKFRQVCKQTINPYGEGHANDTIFEILKKTDLKGIIRKQFVDFPEVL